MGRTNVKELSDEQLVHRILNSERELVGARFTHSMNRLENTAQLRVYRREIARLRTELRNREVAQGSLKDSLLSSHRSSFSSGSAPDTSGPQRGGFLQGIVDKLSDAE